MTIRRFDVTEDRVCEYEVYGDMVQDSSGAYVLFEDYYASHAYDEAKERELFSAEFKLEGKIYFDENTKQWLPTSDSVKGFQMAERTLGCWIGWSACAKSRARSAE